MDAVSTRKKIVRRTCRSRSSGNERLPTTSWRLLRARSRRIPLRAARRERADGRESGTYEQDLRNDTHLMAPTRFIEANGVRYAYRRFGSEEGTPLVLLAHFRAGLDHWDPVVTDGLASGRPVILFNNAGVASSSGEPADTIDAAADHVARFVRALGLQAVDGLGFSIGGYVSQGFVLRYPGLVRRLVLAGTAPRNGELANDPRIPGVAANPVPTLADFLFLFFTPCAASQAAGKAFWQRRHQPKHADPPSSPAPMHAHPPALP